MQVHERPCLPVFQEPFCRNSRLAFTRSGFQLFHSNDVCDGLRSQRSLVARAVIAIRYFRIFLPLYGEWSHLEAAAILQHVPVGGTVVDVGTHIGTLTIPFAKKVCC